MKNRLHHHVLLKSDITILYERNMVCINNG